MKRSVWILPHGCVMPVAAQRKGRSIPTDPQSDLPMVHGPTSPLASGGLSKDSNESCSPAGTGHRYRKSIRHRDGSIAASSTSPILIRLPT